MRGSWWDYLGWGRWGSLRCARLQGGTAHVRGEVVDEVDEDAAALVKALELVKGGASWAQENRLATVGFTKGHANGLAHIEHAHAARMI